MSEWNIKKVKDGSLKVSTHVGTFVFEKVGYIESVKDYNAEIDRQGHGRHLCKSKYAYMFDRNKEILNPAGCYMIFEKGKEKPSYIGKTQDITLRFRNHICCSYFENCTKNGEKLDIFFCPSRKYSSKRDEFSAGDIEALMIGYLWHKGLWNRF